MSWTTRDTGVSFFSLAVGATLGILAWSYLAEDRGDLPAGEQPAEESSSAELAALRTENQRMSERINSLQASLDREAQEAPARQVEESVEAAETLRAVLAGDLILTDEQFAEVLGKIDWATMGTNMKDMVPLIETLAEQLAAGESPDLALAGQIQRLNGDLLAIAQVIMEGEVPGTGVNGAFTHPMVAGNQIVAALAAAGVALDEGQLEGLEKIMRVYGARDRGLRDVEGSEPFKLLNLLEEIDLKSEFYNEARAMLSPEQAAALYRDSSAGRLGLDVFDPGLMLAGQAQPLEAASSAELAQSLSERLQPSNLSESGKQQLQNIISTWANRHYGEDFWSQPPDPLSKQGMMTSAHVREAMRNQVTLMRTILDQVELTPADRANLMANMRTIVPLVR